MNDSANDLDDAINKCFVAFDEEFKNTFSRFYATALCAVSAHKATPETLGDIDAVLPPLTKGDKAKGDPPAKPKKKKGAMAQMSPKLPIDGTLYYKGEPVKPEKAFETLGEALKHALTQEKVHVHIQDWGIVDMDVEPQVFLQVRATLGDFEAITYRTVSDFLALHDALNKTDVRTQDGQRPKKVGLPANLRSLERAALATKPLKNKASRFDCACRKKSGLEQPHPLPQPNEGDASLSSGVTRNSVVSVGTAFNPRACEAISSPVPNNESAFGAAAAKSDKDKKKGKDSKDTKNGKPRRDTALKRAAVNKLQVGNRTFPVWSAPQPNCHCTCSYCCWGDAAAEVLGSRLQAYLLALCEHCYTEQLVNWLGLGLSSVTLLSFSHGQGVVFLPAVAAEAIRALHAHTVADSNAAALVPAFTNFWQTSLFFNTPEEGLAMWVVAELIRARMTRSVGEAKGSKRLPDPDGRLFQEWLPGASPLRELTKEQIKAREAAKVALMEHVKPMATKHFHDISETYAEFVNKFPPCQAEVDRFFDPLSNQLTNDVLGQCLDNGAREGMECLSKMVCALMEKHVLTRSVMEPLANIDSQLNHFILDSLYESSKGMDADFVSGRRALAISTLTGTRYVISSTIASSAYAFASDLEAMINERKDVLNSLALTGNGAAASGLACIPTLVRAVMHVILSEVPSSFITELSSYMVSVEQAPASSYKSATTNQKEALAKKWQQLRQALCAVAWRAGYLLEKSLAAQYVQYTALQKGGETSKPRRADPTVPSEQDGSKKGKKKATAEKKEDGMVASHPYALSFELDGVKKHLRDLSETSSAAYWNAVLQFSDSLDACVAKAHDDGQDRITPVQWKTFVRQSMRSAFEVSYARMKAQFCTIATDMLIQYVCDVISRNAVGEVVRKTDSCSKVLADATSANADMAQTVKIGVAVDNVVSQVIKTIVAGFVNEWKDSAVDHYHIVSETVARAATYQITEKLTDSSDAADTRSLSVGSNSYSGSGSFTSENAEEEPAPAPEEPKKEETPEEPPKEVAQSASGSATGSSKSKSSGSSHYSSVSHTSSRSASHSASHSGSASGSRSGSGSASGSKTSSKSGSKSGSESGSKSGSSSSKSSKASEPIPEDEENTASEMSEIVPFDRL